jgi:two-component system, chemotaxis family, CheB/CheR fusion protein
MKDHLHYVVGIGASAGGLEAIHELFDSFPKDSGLSFIIVQHLSPDYKSLLAELVSKHTQMKVSEAEDGMLVLPNHVYVIPSKKLMTFRNGRLRLADKPVSNVPNTAIDHFFVSLAEEKGDKVIGVILSGTGTDGSKGILAIKSAGGMVVVQDPATAKFDGMPNSAIDTGVVDLILPPELIPEEIFSFIRHGVLLKTINATNDQDEEKLLGEILHLIKKNTGHDFTAYKLQTIKRRIYKRMAALNFETLHDYLGFLIRHKEEIEILSKEFLIGVTRFFRDSEAFQIIEKKVLPRILDKKKSGDVIKIWVTACSTGEEAYSLAILVHEHLKLTGEDPEVKIFATDVDKEAINFASKGMYSEKIANDVSPQRLDAYFVKEGKHYCINQNIRKMVIFAHHNILKDPPFSKIDLISCRNMLIYMNPILQRKVFATFSFSLNQGGYLFLGASENPGEWRSSLEEVSKKWNVFKNLNPSTSLVTEHQSFTPVSRVGLGSSNLTTSKQANAMLQHRMEEVFNEVIVEEFGYAGIYINENFDVIQAMGDYRNYLHLPEKKLQFNLLKMVNEELSVALGVAIRKAIKANQKVVVKRVKLKDQKSFRLVNVVIKPYMVSNELMQRFVFVMFFEEKAKRAKARDFEIHEDHINNSKRIQELELELKETKENLFATVEELETSNEELQSSNEELISSNEELQSTNEELQSLNEELHTVNTEHQLKIKELIELNDDFNNYFRSTDIGQIFIDANLRIRKYTPAVVKQINIIESDIGRPISHFSINIKYDSLVADIKNVIASQQTIEKEIELNDGRYYLMRIFPYIRLDKNIDGVVITFVDISPIKSLNNILSGVLNSSVNGIMALETIYNEEGNGVDFSCSLFNVAAELMFDLREGEMVGQKLSVKIPAIKKQGLLDKFLNVAKDNQPLKMEWQYWKEGKDVWFDINAVPIKNGIAVTFYDISDKKAAEEKIMDAYDELKKAEENLKVLNFDLEERVKERTMELSESEERFRLISLATNDAVWDWNLYENRVWWNEALRTVFGYDFEYEDEGIESFFNKIHPDDKKKTTDQLYQAINKGETQWSGEYRFRRADGSYAFVFNRAYILYNENQTPFRMLGALVDLTSLKLAKEELTQTNQHLVKINNDLDNFIYTASHDLKAPIANLEGLVVMLRSRYENKEREPEKEIKLLDMVSVSIEKLNETIKALTEITKAQKDKDDQVENLSFEQVLNDVFLDIDNLVKKVSPEILCDFQVEKICYGKFNLRSILYNLVSNAIKYRCPDRPCQIQISTREQDDLIVLEVRDNGLGLNKLQQAKLFKMFKRLHTHVDGTGVGLYIVKRIIENRGGRIEVESEEGIGSSFRVYFQNQSVHHKEKVNRLSDM